MSGNFFNLEIFLAIWSRNWIWNCIFLLKLASQYWLLEILEFFWANIFFLVIWNLLFGLLLNLAKSGDSDFFYLATLIKAWKLKTLLLVKYSEYSYKWDSRPPKASKWQNIYGAGIFVYQKQHSTPSPKEKISGRVLHKWWLQKPRLSKGERSEPLRYEHTKSCRSSPIGSAMAGPICTKLSEDVGGRGEINRG